MALTIHLKVLDASGTIKKEETKDHIKRWEDFQTFLKEERRTLGKVKVHIRPLKMGIRPEVEVTFREEEI